MRRLLKQLLFNKHSMPCDTRCVCMCVHVCTWWLTQFALSLRITRANSWLLFIDDLFHTNNSSAFFQTFSNDTSPLRTKWDTTHPLVVRRKSPLQFLLFLWLNFSIIHVLSKINTEYLMADNTIRSACRYNYAIPCRELFLLFSQDMKHGCLGHWIQNWQLQ